MRNPNRRDFLRITGFAGAVAALAACRSAVPERVSSAPQATDVLPSPTPTPAQTPTPIPTPLAVENEDWRISQTLRRITFGPTQEELDRARSIGLDNFIEEQLAPDSLDDGHMDSYLGAFRTLTLDPAELLEIEPPSTPIIELTTATLYRALYSRRQLYELMVDFWSNHFNIYVRSNPERLLKNQDDRDVIRQHALGRFGDLLSASAHSPAMLTYLDQASSNKDAPNENYARELLELHSLGVDGGYTQLDVEETARIFTGWTVTGPRTGLPFGRFLFVDRIHDTGPKSVLGLEFPAGGRQEEGERLLEILGTHPSTARFIAAKLVRRFVADDPPPKLVELASQAFLDTDGDIRSVLRTILFSDLFTYSLGQKFTRPFEYLAAAIRMTGTKPQNERMYGDFLNQMGQPLFAWPTPDGYPDEAAAWQSTSGMLARWNFALFLSLGGRGIDGISWEDLAGEGQEPFRIIPLIWERLVAEPLPENARAVLENFAADLPDRFMVPGTTALILSSPFFQYR